MRMLSTSTYARLVRLPIVVGREPVKLFESRDNVLSATTPRATNRYEALGVPAPDGSDGNQTADIAPSIGTDAYPYARLPRLPIVLGTVPLI